MDPSGMLADLLTGPFPSAIGYLVFQRRSFKPGFHRELEQVIGV